MASPHREAQGHRLSPAGTTSQPLRLVNSEHVVVHGPRTGWKYEFTPEQPIQPVAASDAEWLIATGLFRKP